MLCELLFVITCTIEQSILGHIAPQKTVKDYLRCTQINKNNVWGIDVEVRVFANLFNANVYVYAYELRYWCIFPLSLTLRDKDVTTKSVYLLHPPAHFDVLSGQSEFANVGSDS